MVEDETSLYVDRFYEMDPEFEDLLPNGRYLQVGMIILFADSLLRGDPSDLAKGGYEAERVRSMNRWATVIHIDRIKEDVVSFVTVYADGVKKKRAFGCGHAWIVKIESIPKCTNPECPQAGDCPYDARLVRECVAGF